MTVPLIRRMSNLHRSAGAFLGVFLFVIMLSGTWSLGSDALRLWWNKAPLSGEHLPLSQLLARQPDSTLVQLPQPANPTITFCLGIGQCDNSYSAISGQPLVQNTPAMWLVTLHKSLFMDFPGRIFISLFGFALAVLLISGFIINRRKLASMMQIPRRRNLRLLIHDLHNGLGLWCYPWLILFAVTGALSGVGALGTVGLASSVNPDHPQLVMQQLMGDFREIASQPPTQGRYQPEQVLTLLEQSYPSFTPQILMRRDNVLIVGGVRAGQPSSANFEQYRFDLHKGQLTGIRDSSEQAFWTRAFISIQPLHYGQYQWLPKLGMVLSVLHFIAGFSGCVLVASGLAMWCWRHSDSPISGVIVGCCGGLLLSTSGLLVVMSLSFALPMRVFFLFWGAIWVMCMVVKHRRQMLILIASLSALLFFIALACSLWQQPAYLTRINFILLFCGVFLLLALVCVAKLSAPQKSDRSGYERSITE
ncbi:MULTISPECIES: PepSY-associated TM helix domain-containing protein [Providencia]|uniref:PepSY domain-containing protein n=2 Tax=Providencia TaxID=586 RepID=A0ABD5L9J6_PROST|nr:MULTISPECIES: PepSY-associated TM helix domain-containing protein [Providencia]ELR5044340.1 PepSY domain-containing protein [Providencia rettgeri]ELR5292444.1 PepSY domain-containing protein [Providencia stuartii]MCR4181122.1 PepSY domain-containing protein [Providencia vermicola]URE79541.1 PepSY domain-containing protein [Providencia stuartii]